MRASCIVLVAAAFIAVSDVAQATPVPVLASEPLDLAHFTATSQNNFSSKRFLRTGHTADEERVGITVPGLETVVNSLKNWLARSKPPESVFTRLKLDKTGDKLFENPQFTAWVTYVDDFNAKNPDKASTMLTTLTTHYGDEALSRMIIAAKKASNTENFAKNLQKKQLLSWLKNGESVDDVFKLLRLDKAGNGILTNLQLDAWINYVKIFDKQNPTKKVGMMKTLTKYYGHSELANILATTKNV